MPLAGGQGSESTLFQTGEGADYGHYITACLPTRISKPNDIFVLSDYILISSVCTSNDASKISKSVKVKLSLFSVFKPTKKTFLRKQSIKLALYWLLLPRHKTDIVIQTFCASRKSEVKSLNWNIVFVMCPTTNYCLRGTFSALKSKF